MKSRKSSRINFNVQPKGGKLPPTKIGKNSNIRSFTVIYAGNIIGKNFQTGHGVLIRECNQIGDDVSIGSHSVVEHHVRIGNNVRIHSGAFIPEYSKLENDCWIGPHAVLTNAKFPASKTTKNHLVGPIIKKGAKIGAGSIIGPGVTVGENSLVGMGSVVTKDIPPATVIYGIPAKVIGRVDKLKYTDGTNPYPPLKKLDKIANVKK